MYNFPKYYDIPSPEEFAFGRSEIKLVALSYKTTEIEQKLLDNIIKATGLQSSEIAHIIKNEESELHIRDVLNRARPEHLLIFGIKPSSIGLHIKCGSYTPIRINKSNLCICDNLKDLQMNKKAKMKLWSLLKHWFQS
jgi:DNA polymerase III psi subunit